MRNGLMTGSASPPSRAPADFPRIRPATAVAGAQPKVAVRLVNGRYSSDFTEEEVASRYEVCRDLVAQLAAYCRRKVFEHPQWSVQDLLAKVAASLRTKGWDLTDDELAWLMERLAEQVDPRRTKSARDS